MPRLLTALRWLTAVGLAYQAFAHLRLAPTYDAVRSRWISQGDLFRAEAVGAVLAALVLLIGRRWWRAAPAALVGGGGLVAVLVYRYVAVGAIGPLPDMTEMLWYPEKSWSALAAATAAVGGALVVVLDRRRRGIRRRPSAPKVTPT